jgi:predicted metalloprotease with PDZ domain
VRPGLACAALAGLLLGQAREAAAQAAHSAIIEASGSVIDLEVTGTLSIAQAMLEGWIKAAAANVAGYFGKFPVPRVRLRVRAGGSGVGHGVTYGTDVPLIRISIGSDTEQADLDDDWVLTHEFAHMGLPDLTSDDRWAEEGLATYVESVARVRAGRLSEAAMWAGLLRGMPQGLPRSTSDVLHENHSWGRTYWGGALFWLVADVRIRERTGGAHTLAEAQRGLLKAGGDIRADWDLTRTLEVADRAIGGRILQDLYAEMALHAAPFDLDALWRDLGIVTVAQRTGGSVSFDERARLASIRRAISGGRASTSSRAALVLPPPSATR